MMKLFVTGATGFIGSNFVKRATENGFSVVAQKRPGSSTRIQTPVKNWVTKQIDDDLTEELNGCDALVHFASHTPNPPYASLSECAYWNVYASISLIEQAASVGIKKIVLAGTCFEYGTSANDFKKIPPNAALKPYMSYPVSKAAASISACGLAREKQLNLQILRIFQAYGDGEAESRFWPSLRNAALNGQDFNMSAGTQIRDFIHVSDICDAFLHALKQDYSKPGKPIVRNIGTGEGTKLIDFARDLWKEWGATGELIPGTVGLRDGEIPEIVADIHSIYTP